MRFHRPSLTPALATAITGAFLVAAVAGGSLLPGEPVPQWVRYTDREVGVRFDHPAHWQVERTGSGTVQVATPDGWARVQVSPNPLRLSPRQWAMRRGGVAEADLAAREIGQVRAAVVTRPGGRVVYVPQAGQMTEVYWQGGDGAFDAWLAGLAFVARSDGPPPSEVQTPTTDGPLQPSVPGDPTPPGPATGGPPQPPVPGDPTPPVPGDPTPPVPGDPTQPGPGDPTQPGPGTGGPQPGLDPPRLSPSPDPTPRQLSPDEFVALFYQADLPDLAPLPAESEITGHDAADERIIALAEERGYRRQAEAAGDLVAVDGEPVQPAAARAWEELVAAASTDDIRMEVVSGYRSVADQREIFRQRVDREGEEHIGRPFTHEEIAAGDADAVIDLVLETSSIPGYSKHHTGYALDLRDAGSDLPFTRFGETDAYDWMSADNFANAKRFGFVPSYPEGSEPQGPMPEEWEFVWVGTEVLLD